MTRLKLTKLLTEFLLALQTHPLEGSIELLGSISLISLFVYYLGNMLRENYSHGNKTLEISASEDYYEKEKYKL